MADTGTEVDVAALQARIATLESSLAAQQRTAAEHTLRLEQSLAEAHQRAEHLANSEEALRERARILQSVLQNVADGIIVADPQGKFLFFNPAAQHMLRIGVTDTPVEHWSARYGCFLPDCLTPYPSHQLPLARAIRGEEVRGAEVFIRHEDLPEGAWLSVNGRPVRDEGGKLRGGSVVIRDVTSRKKVECQVAAQYAVTRVLASAATLSEATPGLLEALGESLNWDFGAVWEVHQDLQYLHCIDTWCRPNVDLHVFETATRSKQMAPGKGLPGRVWVADKSDWISDTLNDSNFPRAAAAAACGIRSGMAFPIRHPSGRVCGVIEFFCRIPHPPDPELLAMFDSLGSQVGQFVERKESEGKLYLTKERFDLAVRGSGSGLWDWDIRTGETYMSPRWKGMLGYEDHEISNVVGQWECRVHPNDRARAEATLHSYLADPTASHYELEHRLQHKDGSYRWILARGVALRDEHGRPFRMAGSHTDITQLKEMMQALRDSEALYHSLVETLPLNILRKDLEGRFTFANRRFCQTLKRPLKEIVGSTDYDFFPAALADKYRADDLRLVRTGELFETTEEYHRTDGSSGYVQVLKTPVHDADGQIVGVQGIFWDVTDRKMAEEATRKAKEAAESANRAKSEFLANMSHEIRTPMNAIIGLSELLLDTTLAPEQREYLDMVRAAADSLMTIINDVLDFSKIEAGKLDFDHVAYTPVDVVEDALRTLAVRAHQKHLELACRVAPHVPISVFGDPHRLRQVLLNLAGNAVKFTESGEVVVEIKPVVSDPNNGSQDVRDQRNPTCHLEFTVTDTGIGIPTDKLTMIFDPFTQVDGGTTRRYGGTGLGLAICSRLVTLMGGQIKATSTLGQGSRFTFTLPLELAEEMPVRPAAPERLRGLRVLVVDDNATNRLILEETLASWDMIPVAVPGAEEALTTLEQAQNDGEPFSLILLDAQMPVMDGFGLAALLKEKPELVRATVMMLSSGTHPGVLARRAELGITGYLTKPVRQAELKRALLEALGATEDMARTKTQRQIRLQPATGPRARLHILLAEDNLFNQRLALGLLEKAGHRVTVVGHGGEAVARVTRETFDLVLMDVQMPEMDGLEATRRIRAAEAPRGSRIPILAMTAHAMKGDRERCLEAGMDGYISKPIHPEELFKAIAQITSTPVLTPSTPPASNATEGPDWDKALNATGGDRGLLGELVKIFLDQYPLWMADLSEGIQTNLPARVKTAAHNIKSPLGNLGAQAAFDVAAQLEQMGKAQNLGGGAETLQQLEGYLNRLRPALEAFVRSNTP